jgi:hypothetical protein
MKSFEDELRNALRREAAPTGFVEKVLAHTCALRQPRTTGWRLFGRFLAQPRLRIAVAAAAACMLAVAGVLHHQRQEHLRQEGELAKEQVTQALRIASAKLNLARRKVEAAGRETSSRRL